MPGPGRDPVRAMGRLARILAVLDNAGAVGATTTQLAQVADYGTAAPQDQLSLDLMNLRKQGWQIDNVTGPGEEGRYRMVSGDNRLRVKLSPRAARRAPARRHPVQPLRPGQAAGGAAGQPHPASRQRRAAARGEQGAVLVAAGRPAEQPHPLLLQGIRRRSPRHGALPELPVVPQRDRRRRRQGQALRREPHARGLPRQAQHRTSVPAVRRIPLHPLCWEIDPPTQATIRASPEYVPDVTRWLMEPDSRKEHDGVADMTYTVTNRAAFRARIYVLGPRATLVGPDDLRDDAR